MATPAPSSRHVLAPGDKLGNHEVIRQIAVGGMAELYLTRTVGIEGFEKLVCVKRILPQYSDNPSFVNMFLNEARLAATLHHPNIAQVYDIGQEAGECFFSMEYVHGEDLGRLIAAGRENGVPISLDCALTLVAGLCAGLHHAHEKAAPDGKPLGVVHRDVSPANVLVSYDGAVKLDFGIARAGGEPSQWTTGLKGKISYMSPEQCRGRPVLDRRSDVFSVGTILYELACGRLPFVDQTQQGVLHQIANRDADPPSAVVPGFPPALEAIVMRALAREPERRFSTALELQNQLEDYAHENRLRVSPLVLARLMSTLFPARLEEWDHARAQGAFFVEQHVVRTLIESGKTADGSPPYTPTPLPQADAGSDGITSLAGAPRAPDVQAMEPTQLGPEPRMSTPSPSLASASAGPSPRPSSSPSHAGPPSRSSSHASPPSRSSSALLPGVGPPSRPSSPSLSGVGPVSRMPSVPGVGPASSPSLPGAEPVSRMSSPSVPGVGPVSRMSSPSVPGVGPGPSPGADQVAAQSMAPPPPRSSQPVATYQPVPTPPPMATQQPVPTPLPFSQPAATYQPVPTPPPFSQPAATYQPVPTPLPFSQPAATYQSVPTPPPFSPAAATYQPVPTPPPFSQPAGGPSSGRFTPGRSSLIPNMPGAVPIVTPLPAPPVPSGGTLVSSATQAGNPPPAVKPVLGPYGSTGLGGLAGQSVQGFASPSGPGQPMQVSYEGPGVPDGMPGQAPGAFGPVYPGDVTDQVRVSGARPTQMIRHPGRARLPIVALVIVGAAGALAGVWLAIGRDGDSTAPAGPSEPAAVVQPSDEATKPSADPATAPGPAGLPPVVADPTKPAGPDKGAGAGTLAAEPARPADPGKGAGAGTLAAVPGTLAAEPAKPADPGKADQPAKVAEPPVKADKPAADPTGDVKADPTQLKPSKAVVQEPHPKAAKPRGRPEPKRVDKRGRKAEPKEPTWNADSPFLPETTPKR